MKVFIVHGWTYSLDKWSGLLEELKKNDIEATMLQVPGLSAPSDEVWDVAKYVAWLRRQIENEDKPIIIAHSNGGRISMQYVADHPDHLKGLILVDSAGISRLEPAVSLKRRIFKPIAKLLKPFVKGKARRGLYKLIGAYDYGNAKPNMRKTMSNMLAFDTHAPIEKVNAPTAVIWGRNDNLTPLKDAYELQNRLPNFISLDIIEEGRHSPQATHPKQVARLISEILRKLK